MQKNTFSTIIRNISYGIFTVLLMSVYLNVNAQLTVSGKNLLDPNGDAIVTRGIENNYGLGLSENGWFIDEIAQTGANAVRLLPNISDGQLTLAQLGNIMEKAKTHGMVMYMSPWTGGSFDFAAWYEQNDVYNLLQQYMDYIVIDGNPEPIYENEQRWVDDNKATIDRLRAKGYTCPINFLSDGYGRRHTTVINRAAEVFDHDPLQNVMFNVQGYWDQNWESPKKYSTELIQERLALLSQLNYYITIGICPWAEGAPCDDGYVDYKTAMTECENYGFGYLYWEWHNPYEWSHVYQLTYDGHFGNWNNHCERDEVNDCRNDGKYGCDYGYQACIGHPASIQNTSVKTPFLLGQTEVVNVTGVSLNQNSLSLEVGQTGTLTATVEPTNASNKAVSWSSSNEAVATVIGGIVTTASEGTATITATTDDGGFTDDCIVDVVPAQLYTLTINNGSGSGDYTSGTVVDISADAAPEGQQFAQWTGDVANVANVNSASTTITMPASSATLTATYEDIPDEGLLTGTQFDNISPYSGNPDVDGHAAFDGDVSTYVDAGTGSGAYTGLELNNPASLTMIRYYPRANYAGRMVGGIFQGSNDGVNYVDLHNISTEPVYNWNEVVLTTEAYSYYRYMSAPEGYCNVAEIEFWGSYGDIPVGTYYSLTVNSGSGSGNYAEGTVVNILANAAPAGQQFAQWTGDVANVANVNNASTSITMPASNVSLTATYQNNPVGTSFSLYFIGNSVTDACNYNGVDAIAESTGNTHVWGRHMIPGAPLSWIWEHPDGGVSEEPFGYYDNALPNYTWDAISLQPYDRQLNGTDGDVTMAGNFINLTKGSSPNVQIYIYGAWPRKPDPFQNTAEEWSNLWTREYPGNWDGTNETRDYYEQLAQALRNNHTDIKPVLIIPIGEVFYQLNQKMANGQVPGFNKIWDVYADGIHLTNVGGYIAGLTVYSTTYMADPRGTQLPSNYGTINPDVVSVIQQTVWEVVSGYSWSGVNSQTIPVEGITVTPESLSLEVGETGQLSKTVTPDDATNKEVVWSTSNELVAQLSSDGLVTATGEGIASITATTSDGGFSDYSTITVTSESTGDPEAPTAPSNLIASNVKHDNLTLSWDHATDNIGVVGYDVFVNANKINGDIIVNNNYSITGLATCTDYDLTVKAYDAAGNSNTSDVFTVKTNCQPAAVLNASPQSGTAPLSVNFDADGSSDPDPDDFILGYEWDFGDGSTINNSNSPSHTYSQAGEYVVTLRVMDNRDFYSEPVSQTIVVNGESSNDELLTGTQFDNISPYVGNPDLDGHAAFDGDVGTYVDAASASGACTGIELDNPASLTMIRYYPRDFYAGAERMVGGIFQGSNDGVNYVDLHTISTEPAYNWNEVVLTTEAYSYYRYMSAPDGYCNVAEIEFWGSSNDIPVVNYTLAVNNGSGSGDYTESTVVNIAADAASSGQQFAQWTGDVAYIANVNSTSTTLTMPAVDITVTATYEDAPDQVLLSGTQFDSVSPYQGNNGVDGQAAFDENVNSYVDAWAANGAYTGIELDNPASLSMIRYYPRESWAGRMVGGIFQGSNDGVNYVDLHNISTEPVYNWNEVVLTTEAYSYYRYMSAPEGYCNVAEIEFWGSYNQLKSLSTSSDVTVNQFKGFTIYPNPVNQFINVSCLQTDDVKEIEIIDVSGKVLLERSMQSNNFTLSVGHLEEGMYIIRVMSGKKMYSQKLYVTE